MKPISILLADDHAIVRKGIQYLTQTEPDLEIVGAAKDGREAVEMCERLRPDVVILDYSMPNVNGLEAAKQISRLNFTPSMIMLSMHTDETYIMRAISAGVSGYVSKESVEDEIIEAIRTVVTGTPYLSPSLAHRLLKNGSALSGNSRANLGELRDPYDSLTSRERETLQLIAEGKTNKEIASVLNLSPYTVDKYRAGLMQKLDLHTVAEIVIFAVRRKLVR
ncbi:MAG: response regulator transcription factor [Acidobacteriota bacterium]|nr:response regulator transcription factor [Acidobacteriota bacterium]